jgi:hypothetical protein
MRQGATQARRPLAGRSASSCLLAGKTLTYGGANRMNVGLGHPCLTPYSAHTAADSETQFSNPSAFGHANLVRRTARRHCGCMRR